VEKDFKKKKNLQCVLRGFKKKKKKKKKSCPNATLSTTKLKWTGIGSNPGLRGEKPATKRFSHNTSWNDTTKKKQPQYFSTQRSLTFDTALLYGRFPPGIRPLVLLIKAA